MDELKAEDLEAIKQILISYKLDGVDNPLLPTDVDMDGDGIADAFGLDEEENVILVSGVSLDDTVYVATGEGDE